MEKRIYIRNLHNTKNASDVFLVRCEIVKLDFRYGNEYYYSIISKPQ